MLFHGQMSYIIFPSCSCSLGSPTTWTCPENFHQKVPGTLIRSKHLSWLLLTWRCQGVWACLQSGNQSPWVMRMPCYSSKTGEFCQKVMIVPHSTLSLAVPTLWPSLPEWLAASCHSEARGRSSRSRLIVRSAEGGKVTAFFHSTEEKHSVSGHTALHLTDFRVALNTPIIIIFDFWQNQKLYSQKSLK